MEYYNTDYETKINVLRIVDGTTVDGPGFRTSVYVAGCTHRCEGCHNPQSWNDRGGEEMTVAQIMGRVRENRLPVTLTGGDPMMHPERIYPLLYALKRDGINVWLYTGYTFEQLLRDTLRRPLLDMIDVLVDGPFILVERDTSLLFKGSSNQRLIDLRRTLSLSPSTPLLWKSDF